MHQLNLVFQIATATLLALVCILLAKHWRSGMNTWTGVGFALSILCYIIIESDVIQSILILRIIVSIVVICIPVSFWVLARAIFDDHFKFRLSLLIWFLVLIIPHLNFFIGDLIPWPGFSQVASVVARFASLGFVLAGLYTALRTRQGDLVDTRIRFRNIFLSGTAALIGITLIVELISISRDTIILLQILQRLAIFGITLYFLLSNFGMRPGFLFKEIPKSKATAIEDPQLGSRLRVLMEEQRVYRKEGLTIGALAELMNEQEYRLRRLINGQLGFRNFS